MCVIMIVDKVRPTPKMIDAAWERNKHGGGLAWRDEKNGKKVVHWKKGIQTVDLMKQLMADLPLPYIAHFRIASVDGGGVNPKLTHPFPIATNVPLSLEGTTEGDVLFHNGNWKDWDELARQAVVQTGTKIPTGKWSDTRGIAWLCALYGNGFMELLPQQKGIIFGPKGYEIFTGFGWEEVEDGDVKIWCSNKLFWPPPPTPTVTNYGGYRHNGNVHGSFHDNRSYDIKPMCPWPKCVINDNLDAKGYCYKHRGGVLQEVGSGTGGSQAVIPFPVESPLIPLSLAERLNREGTRDIHGEKLVSNNQMKKVRALYNELNSSSKKRQEQAQKELRKITLRIGLKSRILSM